jgi:hypothetical protein
MRGCKFNVTVYFELMSKCVDSMRMGPMAGFCKHVNGHSGFREPEVLTR